MVKKKRNKRSLIPAVASLAHRFKRKRQRVRPRPRNVLIMITVLSIMIFACGCQRPGAADDPDVTDSKRYASGSIDHDTEETRETAIYGPDIPPEGMRYDEWKGFKYTTDTVFPVVTYWAAGTYTGRPAAFEGIRQEPLNIEDGLLEITDAKAEPVGGEMKLRSGGYVDITIEAKWTGTMNYTAEDEFSAQFLSFAWADNELLPCDAYTGTSLINYSDDEDGNSDSINVGEASDTGLVESDVTWKGKTWRLFAKQDKRNASFSGTNISGNGSRVTGSVPGNVEVTLTLRVPADYDGMVLAIDKDISDEKSSHLNESAEFLNVSDTYADILTTDTGVKQTADDFYFIKVSDLLEKFNG